MKKLLTLLLFFIITTHLVGQTWTQVSPKEVSIKGEVYVSASSYSVFKVDDTSLRNQIWNAQHESASDDIEAATYILVPLPDGQMVQFRVVRYDMMEAELASKWNEIRTFHGWSVTGKRTRIRIDATARGVRMMILGNGDQIFIDQYMTGDVNYKVVYHKRDAISRSTFSCGTQSEARNDNGGSQRNSSFGDCQLRTYRLALACTGEYATFHGGTVPQVAAAMVTSMNRVNGLYEYDVAARMLLVANNNTLIFLDPNTDPYTNNNGGTMLGQNQTTITNAIGTANYDIGHVFSTGGGGVASLSSVCSSSSKARGVTGRGTPVGDAFDIDYVAHEIGHQFGGNHTFNNSCNSNRNASTAMEPGSGSSIMAYAGICTPNVQPNSDAIFHARSVQEIKSDMLAADHTCETILPAFVNTAPVLQFVPDFSIPASTPFVLELSATDAQGDTLEYYWDQMDAAVATMPPTSNNSSGPAFRNILATTTPRRYFPSYTNVLNNLPNTWEVLTTSSRTYNFRGSVKDHHVQAGCSDEEDIVVTVDGNAGPFSITSQATPTVWNGGTMQTITWNVANTNAAPINAANIMILLSRNDGLTFPDTLSFSTPNDGTETLTIPNPIASFTGRILIKPVGNVFYDINSASITVNPGVEPCTIVTNVNASGFGSLTNALDCSVSGDTIKFAPSMNNQIFVLASDGLSRAKSLNIFAAPGQNITLRHTGANPLVNVPVGTAYVLTGLILENLSMTSSVIINNNRISINRCTLRKPTGNAQQFLFNQAGSRADVYDNVVMSSF